MLAGTLSEGSGVHDRDFIFEPRPQCPILQAGTLRIQLGEDPSVALVMPGDWLADEEVTLNHPVLVGRCDQSDLHIHDTWTSRRHCELVATEDGVMVRDIGSRHGTFVNHKPVRQQVLREGDELSVGLMRFVVTYEP